MRVRLTDGTRHLDIKAKGATLPDIEATALRLLAALPTPTEDPTPQPDTDPPAFGFTLDGTSLSADIERPGPHQLPELQHPRDQDDDEDDEA